MGCGENDASILAGMLDLNVSPMNKKLGLRKSK
jgi:hypothetical protein